jgi:hypothetical protein
VGCDSVQLGWSPKFGGTFRLQLQDIRANGGKTYQQTGNSEFSAYRLNLLIFGLAQPGMSQVPFPIRSLDFSIYVIHPAAL